MEWNKLDVTLRKFESLQYFRNALLTVGRPTAKPIYNIHNPIGLKFLTWLRLSLSHLKQHKFKHNLQDCINPLSRCSLEIESLSHFFLHCHFFIILQSVDANIPKFSDNEKVDLLLCGSPKSELKNLNFLY